MGCLERVLNNKAIHVAQDFTCPFHGKDSDASDVDDTPDARGNALPLCKMCARTEHGIAATMNARIKIWGQKRNTPWPRSYRHPLKWVYEVNICALFFAYIAEFLLWAV